MTPEQLKRGNELVELLEEAERVYKATLSEGTSIKTPKAVSIQIEHRTGQTPRIDITSTDLSYRVVNFLNATARDRIKDLKKELEEL